ncbi:hypothetical protein D018_4809A, partial [Vibrio parahaemolyticus VP2007-007]
MAGLFFF